MKNPIQKLAVVTLFISSILSAQTTSLPFQLEKKWEVMGFDNPESVTEHKKTLYVSNVNGAPTDKDANGYISKVSLDGKMIEQKWITGLNAPKGLAVYKNTLYVADIDEIVAINIKTKKRKIYKVTGATFLNDVTVDKKGGVYVSNTFGFSAIYKLHKKQVKLWLKSEKLRLPNGLHVENQNLYTVNWGLNPNPKNYETEVLGNLLKINTHSKKITTLTSPFANLDGISKTIHGFLVTDWLKGKLLYINKDHQIIKVLDLNKGIADTYFNTKTKTLYVPQMLENKLITYRFK